MKVPLVDLDIGEEELESVKEVIESKWLTMGENTSRFEASFAEYMGVKHGIAVSNCTSGLHLAHSVLGVGGGDEVICPSLTFVATANSILYTGAQPRFADISSLEDLNISPESILKNITSSTKAITVVHYGGYACEMEKIVEIAKQYNLGIIEDAAHAPGVKVNGRFLGTLGDVGCFSFFSNKNMTTGEGGMVVTNNDELAEKIRRMRSHGMTTQTLDRHKGHSFSYDVTHLGYNYRLDEIRSAMGMVQLKKLKDNNEKRRLISKKYREDLSGIKGVSIPFSNINHYSSYHLFPILLQNSEKRQEFMSYMREKGIQTSIHYPPVHLFQYYKDRFKYNPGMLPYTEEACRREVTLPLYPNLDDESLDYVIHTIKSFF